VSWLPGRGTPPHDHGTWAVVAGGFFWLALLLLLTLGDYLTRGPGWLRYG
jgi:hypothetical protein